MMWGRLCPADSPTMSKSCPSPANARRCSVQAKDVFPLFKDTWKEWNEDKASRLGAAVSYYTIFSLAPLLIVVIAIAGLVFGQQAVRGQIVGQIQGLVGTDGAQLIQTMIANASQPSSSILASVVGI